MREYDAVVIGAGPGGYETAIQLGQGGMKTLLIDKNRERIGGTCLNEGCIPAKLYLECAEYALRAPYFNGCGIEAQRGSLDLEALKERKRSLISELRSGIVWGLDQAGVEFLEGEASFADPHTLQVAQEAIRFRYCVIATGSVFREVPGLNLDGERILSSKEVFELDTLPTSIVILGGGAIGCEFATFFNAFGSDVTLIQRKDRLLPSEDTEVAKALMREYKKRGIRVLTLTEVQEARSSGDGVELVTVGESPGTIRCEKVLCATGRRPNTGGLNLHQGGVSADPRGFVEVNAYLQSVQEHIYAIGDCIDSPAYAHRAYAEASVAAKNILGAGRLQVTPVTPSVVFSHPQVASCGLSEEEAKQKGMAVEVVKGYFKVNAKAKIYGDDSGFAKVVAEAQSGTVLGAAIIGVRATEIIHEMVMAVEKKITLNELRSSIHAHPTVSEIVRFL